MKKPLIGIIGGTGQMGQWFKRFFTKQGYKVLISGEKTKLTNKKLAEQCDVVIISVPIDVTVKTINQISKSVRKDALLMDSQQNILQTPWEEKLKLEESIIKKALDIIDDNEQFIILQQEVAKIIREATHVKDILEDIKEIYEDDLIDRMSRELMIPKINHYRLSVDLKNVF